VAQDLEERLLRKVRDVLLAAGKVIVHAQDIMAGREQLFAQMRAEEARAAGHQYLLHSLSVMIECQTPPVQRLMASSRGKQYIVKAVRPAEECMTPSGRYLPSGRRI
jgi:hypothetical protein